MISATWGSSALTLRCMATVSDKASLALTNTPCPPLNMECFDPELFVFSLYLPEDSGQQQGVTALALRDLVRALTWLEAKVHHEVLPRLASVGARDGAAEGPARIPHRAAQVTQSQRPGQRA